MDGNGLEAEFRGEAAPKGWREARLDMVLAEELAVSPEFTRWFAGTAFNRCGQPLPDGLHEAEATINFNHDVGIVEAFGEDDLYIVLTWAGGTTRRLLVEDKVSSGFTPDQAERYRMRAESCGAAAVLVAPQRWLDGHAAESRLFHDCRSVEDIAAWMENESAASHLVLQRRLRWRAGLLRELARPQARTPPVLHPPTIEFRDYCVDWLKARAPSAIVDLTSLRTENLGWLSFKQPAGLIYKVGGYNNMRRGTTDIGFVDLEVKHHGFAGDIAALDELLASAGGGPAGFVPDRDTARRPNVVLRCHVAKLDPNAGVPADATGLNGALAACRRMVEWLEGGGAQLLAAK